METGSGNWTWDNGTVEVECNKSLENRTWLGEQLHTGQMVDQAVSPVWYLVGVTGNIVSAWIWTRRRMRRNNSSAVYLATLSVNDTLFLLLHILQELKYAWKLRTVDYPVVCELYAFIYLVTQYLAPMLVLGFTVERFIAICYPYQKVRYCTAGRAVKVSVCMVVGCLMLGAMQLYLWTYDSESESCEVRRSAMSLFSIWSWITEMMIFLVVPVIILIVNILVMREVWRMSNPVVESAISSTRLKPSRSAATNAMLLSVSFYVIFTTLPATIVYVLSTVFDEGEFLDASCHPVDMASDPVWRRYVAYFTVRKIVDEVCLSHYACNFFMFVITGFEFRRELCRWLGCRAVPSEASSYNENGATEYTLTTVGRAHGRNSPLSPQPDMQVVLDAEGNEAEVLVEAWSADTLVDD